MSGLIGEVKSQATEITRMVQEIDDNIQALDEEIENVSATTEGACSGYGRDSGFLRRDQCNVP